MSAFRVNYGSMVLHRWLTWFRKHKRKWKKSALILYSFILKVDKEEMTKWIKCVFPELFAYAFHLTGDTITSNLSYAPALDRSMQPNDFIYLLWSVAGFLPVGFEFSPRVIHVGFLVLTVAQQRGFSLGTSVSSCQLPFRHCSVVVYRQGLIKQDAILSHCYI